VDGVEGRLFIENSWLFGADPDRIGLLGKPPAEQHSFPFKSQ
jgi:hypothetical protein